MRLIYNLQNVYDFYSQRPQIPVQTFTIMPQCVSLVRIAYLGMYCLELRLRGGGLVSLRDGAYSRFDRSNVVDEFTPTQALKVIIKDQLCFVWFACLASKTFNILNLCK